VIFRDEMTGQRTAPGSVAILRALQLGDMLCAVPTLRALRHNWPAAQITLVSLPWAREFAEQFSRYIDRYVEFPGYPGLPEREPLIERIPSFLAELQEQQFDLAMQLQGSGTIVNSLVALFGARRTAGFFPPNYYCPNPAMFAPWPERGLEVHRLLSLVSFLGLATVGDELELPLGEGDFERLASITCATLTPRRFVVVHPGASVPARRWPLERFAAIADALADAGFAVALSGVASERALTARLAGLMRHRAIDLAGHTDLGTLGALVAKAALVVCNDTGISHVAAATETPSVVISTGENPARWSPANRRLHRVMCRAEGVEVDAVRRAALSLIGSCLVPLSRSPAVLEKQLLTT
jgi:ADP-heptose:LPS heptosyltransferase